MFRSDYYRVLLELAERNITKSKMVGIILFAFGVGYLVMVLHQTGEDNGGTLPFSVGCGSAQKTLVCQALRGYGVGP